MNSWPQCEHMQHYYFGILKDAGERCKHGAEFSVMNLTTLDIKLSCAEHLAAMVYKQSEMMYECQRSEHPVVVRQLYEGGIGWPTSSE